MNYHISFDLDFKRNPYPGKFIVLEGIDGSGKTTQVERLAAYFKKKGVSILSTKEPTRDGEIGALIHSILQSKIDVPAISIQYLLGADRAVHYEKTVIPALKRGETVISDRCFWSAVPYGMADRDGVDEDTKKALVVAQGILSFYHQFIAPDMTFYLRVSEDLALKRLAKMEKVKELYEKKEKLEKIRKGYEWLISQFPKEITVVDGERGVEEVTMEILERISSIK